MTRFVDEKLEPLAMKMTASTSYYVTIAGGGQDLHLMATSESGNTRKVAVLGSKHDLTAHRGATYRVEDGWVIRRVDRARAELEANEAVLSSSGVTAFAKELSTELVTTWRRAFAPHYDEHGFTLAFWRMRTARGVELDLFFAAASPPASVPRTAAIVAAVSRIAGATADSTRVVIDIDLDTAKAIARTGAKSLASGKATTRANAKAPAKAPAKAAAKATPAKAKAGARAKAKGSANKAKGKARSRSRRRSPARVRSRAFRSTESGQRPARKRGHPREMFARRDQATGGRRQ